jgi:ketosteroid isomerase-like protein
MTAKLDGFNVQAAVRIEADDDEGRELLLRYCARPCFALERLSMLPDGRVAYRIKYTGRGCRGVSDENGCMLRPVPARVALLVLVLTTNACARRVPARPEGAAPMADVASLLQLEQELFSAFQRQDTEALAEFFTEDFILHSADGQSIRRTQLLASVKDIPGTVISVKGHDVRARIVHGMGVLTGLQISLVRLQDGSEVTDVSSFTDICVRENGHWKVAFAHNLPAMLPAP